MSVAFMKLVEQRSAEALASGALQPIRAQETKIDDQGLPFRVRWVSSLSAKDSAKTTMPGGPRDPDFNPFLAPEPALTIGPIGTQHVAILNKFPICQYHLVLARREFEEQLLPLTREDFMAMTVIMSQSGGLGFYNGGTAAGASQRHKHVQWIPDAPDNANLQFLTQGLPDGLQELAVAVHPKLPIRHAFVKALCGPGTPAEDSAISLHRAFVVACEALGMVEDKVGLLPPFNMLTENGWLLIVPRSHEYAHDVSVNALSYGGTLYVRHPEQVESIRQTGPLSVLVQAAYS